MRFRTVCTTGLAVAALTLLGPVTADAGEPQARSRSEGRARAGGSTRSGGGRAEVGSARQAPRAEAGRRAQPRSAVGESRPQGRPQGQVSRGAPDRERGGRGVAGSVRPDAGRYTGSRRVGPAPASPGRRVDDHSRYAVPRSRYGTAPRGRPGTGSYYSERGRGYVAPRDYAPRAVRPYSYGYRSYRAPRVYLARPYHFRPRLHIGFGLFAGYPVVYPYAYPVAPLYPYGGYATSYVVPSARTYGGISFDITPWDAEVFVDGVYMGTVNLFDGTSQALTLSAGIHRIELHAAGYEPAIFDVDIVPGQLIPYRGDLQPTW